MQPLKITFADSVTSTNECLKREAQSGAPEGSVLVADTQSGGYGRLSRPFFSERGSGLYMSLLLRPRFSPAATPLLTHAAALAAAEATEHLSGERAGIKWVNDVYLHDKKVAGILLESALAADGTLAYAILGIGVNLLPPKGGFPKELSGAGAVLSSQQASFALSREAFMKVFLARFAEIYDKMPDTAFLEAYRERSFLLGKEVTVFDALTDREKKGKGTPARALSVTDEGGLLVLFPDGRREVLASGEVTLSL